MQDKSNKIVSIIVVTSGAGEYLISCLDSIQEQTYGNLKVIVIDNSLRQDFGHQTLRRYPQIKLLAQQSRLSYCDSLNLGISQTTGNYILCLNDDVILDKRFIQEALKGFEIGQRIGMASGRILRQDKETIDSTGLFLSIWRTAKERGYGKKDKGQYNKEGFIFGVNGAVAFYHREMLDDIRFGEDYFDPNFRFFYEDLDLAWRANKLGWKGYYIPSAIAFHARGASVRQGKGLNRKYARRYINKELHFDLIKNRYLTIIKNETLLGFLLHLPFIILYDILAWGYILLFRPRLLKILFSKGIPISAAFRNRH